MRNASEPLRMNVTDRHTESLPHHDESTATVAASPDRVYAFIDNPERLASHMGQSSWRMGGGHMTTTVDDGLGQQVGSTLVTNRLARFTTGSAWLQSAGLRRQVDWSWALAPETSTPGWRTCWRARAAHSFAHLRRAWLSWC